MVPSCMTCTMLGAVNRLVHKCSSTLQSGFKIGVGSGRRKVDLSWIYHQGCFLPWWPWSPDSMGKASAKAVPSAQTSEWEVRQKQNLYFPGHTGSNPSFLVCETIHGLRSFPRRALSPSVMSLVNLKIPPLLWSVLQWWNRESIEWYGVLIKLLLVCICEP